MNKLSQEQINEFSFGIRDVVSFLNDAGFVISHGFSSVDTHDHRVEMFIDCSPDELFKKTDEVYNLFLGAGFSSYLLLDIIEGIYTPMNKNAQIVIKNINDSDLSYMQFSKKLREQNE